MSNEIVQAKVSLASKLASRFSIEEAQLLTTLKATAFKVRDGVATNEQMTALMIVADQYGLNPFTKELFAFPDKHNGIVPVVSVDGWSRIINENRALDGIEFRYADKLVTMKNAKPCPEWCEAVIHRKDRAQPIVAREYLDEVFRELSYTNPWQTHTKRFLRHKALIQCARIAFGFAGIYDEDEAERIIEGDHLRITPTAGAMSALPIARQEIVMETAAQVRALLANDQALDAYALIENSRFDSEEQIALQTQLDSKQKGILFRMGEAERAQQSGTISEPQKKRLEARVKEIGLEREQVKKECMDKWGVAHFAELTRSQYEELDQMLTAHSAEQMAKLIAPAPPPQTPPTPPAAVASDAGATISREQIAEILSLCEMSGVKVDRLLVASKLRKIDDMLAEDFQRAVAWVAKASKGAK